jgi:hypothetical protein
VHRFFHRLHVELDDAEDDAPAPGAAEGAQR